MPEIKKKRFNALLSLSKGLPSLGPNFSLYLLIKCWLLVTWWNLTRLFVLKLS